MQWFNYRIFVLKQIEPLNHLSKRGVKQQSIAISWEYEIGYWAKAKNWIGSPFSIGFFSMQQFFIGFKQQERIYLMELEKPSFVSGRVCERSGDVQHVRLRALACWWVRRAKETAQSPNPHLGETHAKACRLWDVRQGELHVASHSHEWAGRYAQAGDGFARNHQHWVVSDQGVQGSPELLSPLL